jgi:glycosyltransferase involved in cell wall biosynthesis
MKKTKILYCITKGNWGGAQKYVYDLATSLPKDIYDVNVLLGADGILAQKLQTSGVRTIVLENLSRDVNFLKDFSAFRKLFKIFRKERPDIIHLNSSKMGFLGALAGRLACIPKIIFTGHGWAFNEDRNQWQKKSIYLLHLLTIALANKTIAVSEQTKNQISKNNSYSKKIVVIRNGIEEINFLDKKSARKKISEKLPADLDIGNRLWLGTISELHKNKGLKYMIEAMHLLDVASDTKADLPILVIIGEGERREKLQQRIDRYGLDDTVFLVGQIDEAEKYLKAFDIFTLTSITEALPYVILEASQAGLPIVASGVGGIPEIITDMESGILVRPKEPEEIQKAIDFLVNKPDKMSLFGQNIQKKISREFSKEDMVKKSIQLYNS